MLNRVDELTLRLLSGEITDPEFQELENLVQSDTQAAQAHIALLELDAALRSREHSSDLWPKVEQRLNHTLAERLTRGVMADLAVLPSPLPREAPPLADSSKFKRKLYRFGGGVALFVVLGIVSWFAFQERSPQESGNPVRPDISLEPRVAALSGRVEAVSPTGEAIELQVGATLPADVTFRLADATGPLILQDARANRVELSPGAMVRQHLTQSIPRYILSQGDLRIATESDQGIQIETSHVAVRLADKNCRLQISAGEMTQVGVIEGKASVTLRATGKTKNVSEGFALLAAEDSADMLVMSLGSQVDRPPQLIGREFCLTVGYGPDQRLTLLRPRGVLRLGNKPAPASFETLLETVLVRSRGSIYSHINFGGVAPFTPNHKKFVGCSHDGVIWVWDAIEQKQVARLDTGEIFSQVCRIEAPPLAEWVALLRPEEDQSQRVRWWNLLDQKERKPIELGAVKGRSLSASPDGKYLAVGIEDRTSKQRVLVFDTQTGERLGAISHSPTTPVSGKVGRFHPNSSQLLTIGHGGILALWSMPDLNRVAQFSFAGEPVAVAFSPDGKTLAVVGRSGDLLIYDLPSCAVRGRFAAVAKNPHSLGFSADGKKLVVGFHESSAVYEFDLSTIPQKEKGT